VAVTMIAAHAAGIRVFVTGGIGGVHRGVTETGDVSSDLYALARVPVAVVSAGAKAILELPRTIELLETLGVPVRGYRCDEVPAFYRRTSGASRCSL
jgi:pseudouridine-5'-phosphate glycosidase